MPQELSIRHVLNGVIVHAGCQTLVFTDSTAAQVPQPAPPPVSEPEYATIAAPLPANYAPGMERPRVARDR